MIKPRLATGFSLWPSLAALAAICALTSGCDVDLGSQTFNLQMIAVESVPEGAAGDKSPEHLSYQLTGIQFNAASGGSDKSFSLKEPETRYRIVARPQILFSQKLEDLDDAEFTSATITFAPGVTGTSSAGDNLEFTMATTSLASPGFTIKKGRDTNIIIKILWKNTVSGTTISEPSYQLSVKH